jgi:hypothetical protein
VRAAIRCKVDEAELEKCKVGGYGGGSGEWRGYNRALTHVRLEYRYCAMLRFGNKIKNKNKSKRRCDLFFVVLGVLQVFSWMAGGSRGSGVEIERKETGFKGYGS